MKKTRVPLSPYFGILATVSFLFLGLTAGEAQSSGERVPPQRPNQMDVSRANPSATVAPPKVNPAPKAQMAQAPQEEGPMRFGPYEALVFDANILQEVVVKDPNNTIWLRLDPQFKDKEIRIKISTEKGANYRRWYSGQNTIEDGYVLVSPAFAGKGKNQLSDWLRTSSPYVEYWMDGKLFLHLKRVGS